MSITFIIRYMWRNVWDWGASGYLASELLPDNPTYRHKDLRFLFKLNEVTVRALLPHSMDSLAKSFPLSRICRHSLELPIIHEAFGAQSFSPSEHSDCDSITTGGADLTFLIELEFKRFFKCRFQFPCLGQLQVIAS